MASLLGSAQQPTVQWRDGEIWLTRDGSPPTPITSDGCEKGRGPEWAPDKTKFVYFTNTTVDKPQCPTEVVVLSADGVRLTVIPGLDRGNAVMQVDWMGNDRVGVDTHINPSRGQYRVVDIRTGKEVASYFGYGFRPSPDSKHVAHAGGGPHFSPPFAQSDYLMVDDLIIYPRALGSEPYVRPPDPTDRLLYRDIHTFGTELAWSPNGTQIAFIEKVCDWRADNFGSYYGKEENEHWWLIVVSAAGGTPVRTPLPELHGGDVTLRWSGEVRVMVEGGSLSGEYSVAR
jgi:hypothetical protein